MKKYTLFNYIEYLKSDNSKGYWFKRRLYGWGWVPVKWQGWLVVLGFLAFILINGVWFGIKSESQIPTTNEVGIMLGMIFLAIAILIWICFKKGEKPRWSWDAIAHNHKGHK